MEEITLPDFHTIFTTNHHIALKFLLTKLLFQGGTKSGADLITFYFKVGQVLFQGGAEAVISKWVIVYVRVRQNLFQIGQLPPSGAKCFFKIRQLFQSGKII